MINTPNTPHPFLDNSLNNSGPLTASHLMNAPQRMANDANNENVNNGGEQSGQQNKGKGSKGSKGDGNGLLDGKDGKRRIGDLKVPQLGPGGKGPKAPKFNFYWTYVALAALMVGLLFFNQGSTAKRTSWGEVERMIARGDVQRIVGYSSEDLIFVEVTIRKDRLAREAYKDVAKRGVGNEPAAGPH